MQEELSWDAGIAQVEWDELNGMSAASHETSAQTPPFLGVSVGFPYRSISRLPSHKKGWVTRSPAKVESLAT